MILLRALLSRHLRKHPHVAQILGNIAFLSVDKFLRMAIGLIVGLLLARNLGPELFGALSFAQAFVGLVAPLASLGLQQIVVRDLVKQPDAIAETLATAVAIRFAAGIFTYCVIVGAILVMQPDDHLLIAMVNIIGLLVVFQTSEIAAFWFESQVKSKFTVLSTALAFAIFTLVRILLLGMEAPVIAYAIAASAEAALSACFLTLVFLRSGQTPQLSRVAPKRALQLLRDSWPLLLSGIAVIVYMRIDQVMLGQMLDLEAVGIYGVAVKISEVWYSVPIIIVASIFPALINMREKNPIEYYKLLQRLFDTLVWLAIVIAISITLVAGPLVNFLFGEVFSEAGHILVIHIWTSVFVFVGVASGKWYVLENLQILIMKRALVGAGTNIILNLILIPKMGAAGAAWATLTSQAMAALVFDYFQSHTRLIFFMKIRSLYPVHNFRKSK